MNKEHHFQQLAELIKKLPFKDEIINYITPDSVSVICLNRPQKFNSLTFPMYLHIPKLLKEANEDPNIKGVILIGKGKNFCCGNDLNNFLAFPDYADDEHRGIMAEYMAFQVMEPFVQAFIDLDKPIGVIVQGQAIGIGMTLLGLCDFVFAYEDSSFQTPMVQLGQGPEGCSSYTFTQIMGKSMASEILLLCRKINGDEAYKFKFVSKLLQKSEDIESVVGNLSKKIGEMPIDCLVDAKKLIKDQKKKEFLRELNHKEATNMVKKWSSPDLIKYLMKFFAVKKPNL